MVKLLALISGGIDSPVAAYMAGSHPKVEVEALFFNGSPYLEAEEEKRVREVCRRLSRLVRLRRLHLLPHGSALQAITSQAERKLTCILCKRMMLRTASKLGEGWASGLVTGDNLGQVASQTLQNLKVEDEASSLPVVRPLIGLNKEEIVAVARRIGTFQVSAVSPAGCRAAPKKPATQASLQTVKMEEGRIPVERLVEDALKARRVLSL